MALLSNIRNLFNNTLGTTMNTSTFALPSFTQSTSLAIPPILRPILTPSEAESDAQELILTARRFHEGKHAVRLTPRLVEWLGPECTLFTVRANYCRRVVDAPAERIVLEGFDSDAANDDEKQAQIEFADSVWRGSRMPGKWLRVVSETIRDGEYFIFVDWDAENARPRLTPHHRFTSTTTSEEAGICGTGDGVRMVYPNDDVDQKPLYAVKRWHEQMLYDDGTIKTQERIFIYTDARIYKYRKAARGWELFSEEGDALDEMGAVLWVDGDGQPLGIPVVHVKTPALEPAAKEAIGPQKAINKLIVDMLVASDFANKMYFAAGWMPQAESFEPGNIAQTDSTEAKLEVIDGEDLEKYIKGADSLISRMADVTNTPLSLLNRSSQRAAEGTLQEEKESFFAKVMAYQETMEIALSDALRIARRLHNAAMPDALRLDEEADFSVRWKALAVRSMDDKAKEAKALMESGYTAQEIQRRVWGESEETIERMAREMMGETGMML